MRKILFILIIPFLTLFLSISEHSTNSTESKLNNYKNIYQLSYNHCELGRDSIVLTRDSIDDIYNKILIFRNKNLIFQYTEKDLEVIGSPFNIFTEQESSVCKDYFYIFKLFNAPDPSIFLIIKSTKEKTFLFGKTKSSTAEIFGDIDYDGKFEIGGFEYYCEANDSTCHRKDLYSIFKIETGFPKDTTLTNYFSKLIKD